MIPTLLNWKAPGWSLRAMLALSVLIPLALFAWTAWSSRAQELEDAEQTAVRTVTALHEHAVKVLDTHEVVLNELNRRIEGHSWKDIETDAKLREDLSHIERAMDQIRAISLIDSEGRVRMTTITPAPLKFSTEDRDYFTVQRDGDAGTYISAPYSGKVLGENLIGISKRRTTPDGRFDGIVLLSVPVSYITSFWQQFAPSIAHVIPLVRSDGQVIARYPALNNPEKLNPKGPFLSRALKQRKGVYTAVSQVDGIERLNAYSQVKNYPLYISFSIETHAILNRWYWSMALYGAYTALAMAALLGMALMSIRQYRTQQAASRRWQEQADRLAAEMEARAKAEAALRQSQKMEAVGQLTGGLAHDFNNLLQAMYGGLQMLSKRVPPDSQKIVNASMQAVERGAKLVRQLMAFSRRQQLKPQPVDVRDLVAGMGDLLQKAAGNGVRIEVEIDRDVAPIMVDPTQTELAILNLVINSRDSMEEKGRITIASRNVEVRGAETGRLAPGSYVALSVTDTGCGMPSAVMEHAFDPFFTTKETGKGTGLGLSMVHGFAHQSGGTAEIDSQPGQGTTVSLYLPKADVAPQGEPLLAGAPMAAGGGETILLVDDEALVRMGIALALRELGYEVHEARNGEEALAVFERGAPVHLMITDYAMPGMHGMELAATACGAHPDLRVILITGNAAFSFDETMSGVSAILRKPFRMEELAQRIRSVLHPSESSRAVVALEDPLRSP